MKILAAHVENHDGWSDAMILVNNQGKRALVEMEWEWESRDGSTKVLWSEADGLAGLEADDVYVADGYEELVDSRLGS